MPGPEKTQLEQERKFLVELPLTWFGKFKVITADKIKIVQYYLKENLDSDTVSRIRCEMYFGTEFPKTKYYYHKKKHVSAGVNVEYERELTQHEYHSMMSKIDDEKNMITKMRYFIDFGDHKRPNNKPFEFDLFEDKLLGLALLEIELNDMSEKLITPPYFKIKKEVTSDKFYTNVELSKIDSYRKITNPIQVQNSTSLLKFPFSSNQISCIDRDSDRFNSGLFRGTRFPRRMD